MMHNKQYAAEIAHNVSARKRAEMYQPDLLDPGCASGELSAVR